MNLQEIAEWLQSHEVGELIGPANGRQLARELQERFSEDLMTNFIPDEATRRTLGRINRYTPEVVVQDLPPAVNNCTLVYGYDIDRTTVHIYIENGHLYVHRYRSSLDASEYSKLEMVSSIRQEHLPSKRAYPERSNLAFAQMALRVGLNISFTTHDPQRVSRDDSGQPKPFQGICRIDDHPEV